MGHGQSTRRILARFWPARFESEMLHQSNANAKWSEQRASQARPNGFKSRRVLHEAGVAGRTARLSSVVIAGSSPVRFSKQCSGSKADPALTKLVCEARYLDGVPSNGGRALDAETAVTRLQLGA